ncbi:MULTISPECIES: hypothetical protein [unclassified Streptomyces]|uniref:hypothetical protein n=1 Tax=Streptomyces TaxID=1883 RepID=UPI0023B9F788|nr:MULTISPECIES: hypothetical protein [unclassified Streptomyces]MDT0423458.1 hypothetical protein [Streptomyces sp. DSM 41859]WEH29840.1 hypothetical protein P0D76_22360 [Streptomyces sp. AM 3-1-1]
MIVALIVVCEVAFWVLLAAGLLLRYAAHRPRLGLAVLLVEPLLEVVLLAATALDLRRGAEPSWTHGLAALYVGYTAAYGRTTLRRLDGHARHRLAGGPRPPRPPRHGRARTAHEVRLWLRTLLAVALACGLLQLAILYVGEADASAPLRSWQFVALRALGIHGLIALSYVLWPQRAPGDKAPGAERS